MRAVRVLFVAYQCNPEWPSEPLIAYRTFAAVRERVDATLVTHRRNQPALDRAGLAREVVYIDDSEAIKRYYALIERAVTRSGVNWPLLHALSYPVYARFNRHAFRAFAPRIAAQEYDLVHAMTPVLPRYPVLLARACATVPFVLGPVNGGLPFPPGFGDLARSEFDSYGVLRRVARRLPGYAATYRRASAVLVGSKHTREMLLGMFPELAGRTIDFSENGVGPEFFAGERGAAEAPRCLRVLFVGRLVPYKGPDVVIEALAGLVDLDLHLDIVGDGPMRGELEAMVRRYSLQDRVRFAGAVEHRRTPPLYAAADVFCFPSIREFGGAVVLEAMAAGLPCIVADHGGIAEYVSAGAGFRMPLTDRASLIADLADRIRRLYGDPKLRREMSGSAVQRAREFEWTRKADRLVRIYEDLIASRAGRAAATRPLRPPATSM
jgi:glycosyltransferase involved in cell wall biosynthesis